MARSRPALRLLAIITLMAGALSVRPAVAQSPTPPQIGMLLAQGWNNFAYAGPTRSVPQALAALAGKYDSIWTWEPNAQRWLGHNPLAPAAGDFNELRQNQAYWVRMNAPGEFFMPVPQSQPAVVLNSGWNNFVYQGRELPVNNALAPAGGRYVTVWRWDAARQLWHGYHPEASVASDFTTLAPFRAYFVKVAAGPQVAVVPASGPPPGALAAPTPVPAAGATATPSATSVAAPRGDGCYSFKSYQPQLTEVTRAQNKAGHLQLTTDPDLRTAPLETQPDGDGAPVPAYVPPALLKAIGWVESGWRQASFATPRGQNGSTITSTSCAYGLMQILSGMEIASNPSAKQLKIGGDYVANIAASVQLLGIKWNFAPDILPVVLPRNPRVLENWYYPVWAYHCFGEICDVLGIHNNPDDPALKWPRPAYNSPDQLSSTGAYAYSEYPYQELVYGVIAHPPTVSGARVWEPLPVKLPARGAVGYPEARSFMQPGNTLDPTAATAP